MILFRAFSFMKRACTITKCKIHIQDFSTTSSLKMLLGRIQTENQNAHLIMEELPVYRSTLANSAIQSFLDNSSLNNCQKSNQTPPINNSNVILSAFIELSLKNVSKCLDFEQEVGNDMKIVLTEETDNLSDEQLFSALFALCLWPPTESPRTKIFKSVWNSLDEECTKRIKNWNIKTILLVADIWYRLNLSRIGTYNSAIINHLSTKLDELSPQEFIQLAFYINLQRMCHSKLLILIEDHLIQLFPTLSLQEISIATLAFFKNQHNMDPGLLLTLVKRMQNEIGNLDSKFIVPLAKILHLGNKPILVPHLISLLNASIPYIKQWNSYACIHMGLITSTSAIDHPEFCTTVIDGMMSDLSNLRLKDICNVLLIMTMFNYKSKKAEEIYNAIISELENPSRQEEIEQNPHVLINCTNYLAYQKLYSIKLLKNVLSTKFLQISEENKRYRWHHNLFSVCCSAHIEWSEFKHCHLPNNMFNVIKKKSLITQTLEQKRAGTFREKFLNDVKEIVVQILGGTEFISIQHILPHYPHEDILVRKTAQNKFIPFGKQLEVLSSAPKNDKWCYISIANRSNYTCNTHKPLGYLSTKFRLLKTLGFHVIEIPWFEFYPVSKSKRKSYLSIKLNQI